MNDITFSPDGRYLYAGTYGGPGWSTGAGLLVRIPVNDDGSAAPAELFTSGLGCNDGLETAADGSIYFADTCNGDIWAYTLYASRRLLLASREVYGDPLDDATSLVLLNSCLYNTELGYFKLQQGLADQTSRRPRRGRPAPARRTRCPCLPPNSVSEGRRPSIGTHHRRTRPRRP